MKLLKEKRSTEFEIHLKGYAGAYYLRNIGKETDKTLEECFGKVMEYFNDSIDMAYEEGKKDVEKIVEDMSMESTGSFIAVDFLKARIKSLT
jgi:hypothetical protein